MPLRVNRIINNLTTPAIRFKQQKFGGNFTGNVTESVKDTFSRKIPQTTEEIKDYLNKKISAIFDKTEEKLNETYERNGYKYYKEKDRESKLISNEETKKEVLMNLRWGYDKKEDKLKNDLPLFEKILDTPEFFEQKLVLRDYSTGYLGNRKEYNLYGITGQRLLYSLINHTETPEKLRIFNKYIDTKPNDFDEIKLFQNVLRQRNLFPEKTNLLEKLISSPELKEQKAFYICYENPVNKLGLETLSELKTPEQVKLLEQIIDDKNKHSLFGAFVGIAIKKMNKEQTEMFSQLIENKDYLERIRTSKVLLESFGDFDDTESLNMFKKYLTTTNEMYKTEIPKNIAPFSVEYNDMHSMLTVYDKDKNPHTINIFNRFLDNKNLYENPLLLNNFGSLLNISKSKEGANIINKILDNEKLCNNEKFVQKLTGIYSLEKENKTEKMRNLYHKYTGLYV